MKTNKLQRKITKKDFKKFVGDIHYFYYFEYNNLGYEVTLEPCLNGFDVALYNRDIRARRYELVTEKFCTNLRGYKFEIKDYERDDKTWDLAIKMANKIVDEYIIKEHPIVYGS